MKLKTKVVLTLFILSLTIGLGSYYSGFAYGVIAGLILLILAFSTLIFADKNDKKVISIMVDGISGGLFH